MGIIGASKVAQWWKIHLQCRRLRRCCFSPWAGKIPCSRKWQHTPVFLPREFHGQRGLVGYSPWVHRVRQDWVTKHKNDAYHCICICLYFFNFWNISVLSSKQWNYITFTCKDYKLMIYWYDFIRSTFFLYFYGCINKT